MTGAVIAAGLALAAGALLRDTPADACGFAAPSVEELTTFDPKILDDDSPDGLYFDPFVEGWGGACEPCLADAMIADWRGFLGGVADADWGKVLREAPEAELTELALHAAGKLPAPPAAYQRSSLWRAPRDRLVPALAVVSLARRIEPLATLDAGAGGFASSTPPPRPSARAAAALLAEAAQGAKAAKHPFLAQRYAFLALRVLFYQRDWARAIAFHDQSAAVLAGPSADLAWRARYYLAGALVRDRKRARANLELARIHVGYPALAGAAIGDFEPMEESDWRETLRRARDVRERTLLWRLVGIKQDGIVAIREIAKLDPRSDLIALLVVRELARAESAHGYGPPGPADLAAQRKALATLEPLVVAQASTPGADRPWLMELVAAHIAARRGDLAQTRARIARALAGKPGDARVAAQAKASLALALVLDGKLDPARQQEVARTMREVGPEFARLAPLRSEVRGALADAAVRAGKLAEAELLRPGTAAGMQGPGGKPAWEDQRFLRELIARAGRTGTAYDAFVLDGSYTRAALEQELALRQLVEGDFAAAAQTFRTTRAASTKLGTDPFAMRIVDCHDCDHQKYANAPWTHASFAARLAELERAARGTGEAAARAALELGNALYNITWYGNARVVLAASHQATRDMAAAQRWYKRAFDLSRDRELRARAAYYAAKAELGALITAAETGGGSLARLPIPATWFPVLRGFSDTRYYREVIRECGHFAVWTRGRGR